MTMAAPLPDGSGLDDAPLPATTAPPTTAIRATAPMPSANGRFIVATIADPSLTPVAALGRLRRAAGYRRSRRSASGAASDAIRRGGEYAGPERQPTRGRRADARRGPHGRHRPHHTVAEGEGPRTSRPSRPPRHGPRRRRPPPTAKRAPAPVDGAGRRDAGRHRGHDRAGRAPRDRRRAARATSRPLSISITQGGARDVHAESVSVTQGGLRNVTAEHVDVHQGGIAERRGRGRRRQHGRRRARARRARLGRARRARDRPRRRAPADAGRGAHGARPRGARRPGPHRHGDRRAGHRSSATPACWC